VKYGIDTKKMPDLEATKLADESDVEESGEVDAAQDILAAVASKDAKALSLALERHYELCKSKSEPDEDDAIDTEA
jgi:DNA-binding GntR family transcriptional regulator